MTKIITLILFFIGIIITVLLIYLHLHKDGTETNNIQNTSDDIMSQRLGSLCIMASSDSIKLDDNASTDNIETLLRKGVRWLDFDVIDNDGVPYVSENIRLDTALNKCKTSKNLSPNSNMPLFINIRVSSSGSEDFYNNIHEFFSQTFTDDELYISPGKVIKPFNGIKEEVMKIMNQTTNDTDKTNNSLTQESFENTNSGLGTENELYENLTSLELAYRSNKTRITEGMKENDDDIENKVRKQEQKVDKLKESNASLLEKIAVFKRDLRRLIKRGRRPGKKSIKEYKKLHMELRSLKIELRVEEVKLRAFIEQEDKSVARSMDKMKTEMNDLNAEAEKKNKELDRIKEQETDPVDNASRSVQIKFNNLRNSELKANAQTATVKRTNGLLEMENESNKQRLRLLTRRTKDMSASVEKAMTLTLNCERCITGDTLLGELGNKVIFVLTRSQFTNDAYKNTKLSRSGKDGLVNIEVRDYVDDSDDKFYNVNYSKDNSDTTLTASLMKMSNVPITTSNETNMIINNIQRRCVQILQVPDLEKKSEYVNIFNFHKSAFIPMSSALKYINEHVR